MEAPAPGAAARESQVSIVDKGWGLISHNTELLFFIAFGFLELVIEASGYKPFFRLNDLLPVLPEPPLDLPDNTTQTAILPGLADNTTQNETEPAYLDHITIVNQISHVMDMIGVYTVHVTIATHILLPYPVLTERLKVLLVPWLVVTFLRSVLRELVVSLMGIVICASHDVFHLPCLKYSAMQGAQFCFVVYVWTSVHSFYHYLNKTRTVEERVTNVIDSIKRSSVAYDADGPADVMQQSVSRVLSVAMDDEDDTDAALVERAAMAWIAREILETDTEHITDKQFGQYLAVKATMELRQALRELAERKRRKARRKLTPKQKVAQSLEYMKWPRNSSDFSTSNSPEAFETGRGLSRSPTFEAFETSQSLSRRDPIRSIRPLTCRGKPVFSDMSILTDVSIFSDATVTSAKSVDSASQTEPPTPHMSRLLDILESQQKQRQQMSLLKEVESQADLLEPID